MRTISVSTTSVSREVICPAETEKSHCPWIVCSTELDRLTICFGMCQVPRFPCVPSGSCSGCGIWATCAPPCSGSVLPVATAWFVHFIDLFMFGLLTFSPSLYLIFNCKIPGARTLFSACEILTRGEVTLDWSLLAPAFPCHYQCCFVIRETGNTVAAKKVLIAS